MRLPLAVASPSGVAVELSEGSGSPPDFAGIQALSSRGAGYAVAEKCLQVQSAAEALDPSLRSERGVRLHDDAWSWYVGALGEIEVGRLLAALGPEWFVRHAVPIGAGTKDVDHLVIGPGGVFAINTKHHAGAAIWVGDYVVKVNQSKNHHVRDAGKDGAAVAQRISAKVGFPVPVTPVVAVLNARSITDGRAATNRSVRVLDASALADWLNGQRQELSDTELALIKIAAEEPNTWHVDPRAANTLRVMHRFERLVGQVGPAPSRGAPVVKRTGSDTSAVRMSTRGPRAAQRNKATRPRREPARRIGDLFRTWFTFGAPAVAILIFRDLANQPCDPSAICLIPVLYSTLRPFLMLAVVALVGMGALSSLAWLIRGRR